MHGCVHAMPDIFMLRVTAIIRTRQKCSIKAIFVAFAVALRQQGCHLKTTNLIFTTSIFDALQFIVCRFGLNQGTKHRHTCRMPSILTRSKGKSATINRGSDYYRYPTFMIAFFCIFCPYRTVQVRQAQASSVRQEQNLYQALPLMQCLLYRYNHRS